MQTFTQQLLTEKVQTITGHGEIGLHFLMQALGAIPNIPASTPAVNSNAILQLLDALAIQLNGQLLVALK